MLSLLGNKTLGRIKNAVEFYLFSTTILLRTFLFGRLKKASLKVLFRQIMFTGYDALPVIGFIALGTSALTILELNQLVGPLGEGPLAFELLVVIVIRQLSIFFTAFVLIARSGTAISTELGNMTVNKEIDLLYSFGISPFEYLVIPRILGLVVALCTLILYFNFFALVGGFVFYNLVYSKIGLQEFLLQVISQLSLSDFILPIIKAVLLGFSIGLISCYHGLKVQTASTEVPQRTIKTVVYSVVAVIVMNIVVTILSYMF